MYDVWLTNKRTGAHFTYSEYPVNSMAQEQGRLLAALDDGIYVLSGEDDNGVDIEAKVLWTPTNLGSAQLKAVDAAYVNYRSNEEFQFIAKIDESEERIYTKDADDTEFAIHTRRVLIPRGLQGSHWQFGFKNSNSGDFDVEDIEILPVTLKRRIR